MDRAGGLRAPRGLTPLVTRTACACRGRSPGRGRICRRSPRASRAVLCAGLCTHQHDRIWGRKGVHLEMTVMRRHSFCARWRRGLQFPVSGRREPPWVRALGQGPVAAPRPGSSQLRPGRPGPPTAAHGHLGYPASAGLGGGGRLGCCAGGCEALALPGGSPQHIWGVCFWLFIPPLTLDIFSAFCHPIIYYFVRQFFFLVL